MAIYIGSIIIVSFIFDLLYFIMVHKIYDNFYNLSPFLTLLTGLYTTFISMFNFPKLFLENHNKEFKKNLPIAMEPWNNHFFVIFLFLVIATFTLNFLKSRQDIKEKEAKKYLIYREIQIERLMQRDKIDRDFALKKINSQDFLEMQKKSDVIFDNSTSLENLEKKVEIALKNLENI
ncbi:MAG: hypothetical protein E6319_05920 [Anaerococcus vaginalis]|nr:hypothetical protein [Anaerococcus vaginalis]